MYVYKHRTKHSFFNPYVFFFHQESATQAICSRKLFVIQNQKEFIHIFYQKAIKDKAIYIYFTESENISGSIINYNINIPKV